MSSSDAPLPMPSIKNNKNPINNEKLPDSSSLFCLGRRCGRVGRVLLFVMGGMAILSSVYTTLSCQFFSLTMMPPDDTSFPDTISHIGIFTYFSPPAIDSDIDTNEEEESYLLSSQQEEAEPSWINLAKCTPYEDQFWKFEGVSPFFWTSQFASIVAPCLGVIAFLMNTVELWQGRFIGSFLTPIILYLLACLVQGYTFVIYGETDFCFGAEANDYGCTLSSAGYVSVAAMVMYYVASVLLCFLPRPEPCRCSRSRGRGKTSMEATATLQENRRDEDEEMSSAPSSALPSSSMESFLVESNNR